MWRKLALLVSGKLPYCVKAGLLRVPVLRQLVRGTYVQLLRTDGENFTTPLGLMAGVTWHISPLVGRAQLLGEYEEKIQEVLHGRVRPGWVVYDVGANVGFFTLLLSRLTGPRGAVLAFEPYPAAFAELRENIRLNDFSSARAWPYALASRAGRISFQIGENASGSQAVQDAIPGGFTAEAKTLDGLVYEEDFPPPQLLKIDVEGSEADVLAGGSRLLAERLPIILCELHTAEQQERVESILKSLSYKITCLDWAPTHILALPRQEPALDRRLDQE